LAGELPPDPKQCRTAASTDDATAAPLASLAANNFAIPTVVKGLDDKAGRRIRLHKVVSKKNSGIHLAPDTASPDSRRLACSADVLPVRDIKAGANQAFFKLADQDGWVFTNHSLQFDCGSQRLESLQPRIVLGLFSTGPVVVVGYGTPADGKHVETNL